MLLDSTHGVEHSRVYDGAPPSVPPRPGPKRARSPYLVQRLRQTPEENLFNHVKFHLIKDAIEALPLATPRILDLGCGLQVSRSYLDALGLRFEYLGVDVEEAFGPDLVADLLDLASLPQRLPWSPEVVLVLDVLEHLHSDAEVLSDVLGSIHALMPEGAWIVLALPQMYRLDRFKLPHLRYPEHKIRLTRVQWRELIERHYSIEAERGLGYLSVIPYLTMASRRYRPDNLLGRLFRYLRGSAMEFAPFKPLDLWLSRAIGEHPALMGLSNDLLVVARKEGGQP